MRAAKLARSPSIVRRRPEARAAPGVGTCVPKCRTRRTKHRAPLIARGEGGGEPPPQAPRDARAQRRDRPGRVAEGRDGEADHACRSSPDRSSPAHEDRQPASSPQAGAHAAPWRKSPASTRGTGEQPACGKTLQSAEYSAGRYFHAAPENEGEFRRLCGAVRQAVAKLPQSLP